jgi:hypothetical protein
MLFNIFHLLLPPRSIHANYRRTPARWNIVEPRLYDGEQGAFGRFRQLEDDQRRGLRRLPFYAVGDAEVLYKLLKLRSAAVQSAGAFTQRNQLDSQSIGACAGRTGSLASELNTGLLVVGGHSRGPWREAVFGGVTTTLVDHAECPAFMMH